MLRATARSTLALLLVLPVVLAVAVGTASAHEQRKVGAYQLTVGWAHEPTYAGSENAVQMFVKDAKGNPIDDLGDPPSLKVDVITGSQTQTLELLAGFDADTGLGTHGEFDAAVIPTRPGTYTFHITGTINGQAIDEKFTSSDSTFDNVVEPTDVEFPAKDPTLGALSTRTDRLTSRLTTAQALATKDAKKAKDASSAATIALIIGIVGVVAGLGLGGSALAAARKSRQA